MTKMKEKLGVLVLGIASFKARYCATTPDTTKVYRCDQITYARPGLGRSFTGHVVNDDYRFTATIPRRMTAWDGVADEAPYHGFVLFLDSRLEACIDFEIQIRIDQESAPKQTASATHMQLGEAKAWQSIHGDDRWVNVSTLFSFKQAGEIDDGEVLLIAPKSRLPEARSIYDALLHSFRFSARSHTQP